MDYKNKPFKNTLLNNFLKIYSEIYKKLKIRIKKID